jgi:hypothetical protein
LKKFLIFSNGGHLGYRTALTDTILKGDNLRIISMILRWSPFKIVSVSAVLYPRWPPLLKIGISSNGQNYGGYLGYRTVLPDTILKGDHLRIISAKFG